MNKTAIILTALLANNQYTRRSAEGIAEQTGFSVDEVRNVLNDPANSGFISKRERPAVTAEGGEEVTPARPTLYQLDQYKFDFYQKANQYFSAVRAS